MCWTCWNLLFCKYGDFSYFFQENSLKDSGFHFFVTMWNLKKKKEKTIMFHYIVVYNLPLTQWNKFFLLVLFIIIIAIKIIIIINTSWDANDFHGCGMVKKHFKIKWSEKISFKYSWTYQNFNNPLLKCLFSKKWCCYFLFCLFSCKLCALLSFIVWWHLLCCWFFNGGMFGGYVGFMVLQLEGDVGVENTDKPNISVEWKI